MAATHFEATVGDKVLMRVDLTAVRTMLDSYERWLDTGEGFAADLTALENASDNLKRFYERHAQCAHCSSYETTYEDGVAYCAEHIQLSPDDKAFEKGRRPQP